MITPSITVLSAVEGLEVATPLFKPYVIPVTIGILMLLFLIQSRGTAQIGAVFGPVIVVWFASIAVLGVAAIVREPAVLLAMNPWYALRFFLINHWQGFIVLGAVFLAVTGGEALYADMGHFGRWPIQIGWYCVALPALLLNYFGQGASILMAPESVSNPFFALAPRWWLLPMHSIVLCDGGPWKKRWAAKKSTVLPRTMWSSCCMRVDTWASRAYRRCVCCLNQRLLCGLRLARDCRDVAAFLLNVNIIF